MGLISRPKVAFIFPDFDVKRPLRWVSNEDSLESWLRVYGIDETQSQTLVARILCDFAIWPDVVLAIGEGCHAAELFNATVDSLERKSAANQVLGDRFPMLFLDKHGKKTNRVGRGAFDCFGSLGNFSKHSIDVFISMGLVGELKSMLGSSPRECEWITLADQGNQIKWTRILQAIAQFNSLGLNPSLEVFAHRCGWSTSTSFPVEMESEEVSISVAVTLQEKIAKIVREHLSFNGDDSSSASLTEAGMDSIAALEIRNHIERELSISVSLRAILEAKNIAKLVEKIESLPPTTSAAKETADKIIIKEIKSDDAGTLLGKMDELTDDQVAELLRQLEAGGNG